MKEKNGARPEINRRMKRISIDPQMVLQMMLPGTWKWATDGIPADVKYVGVTFDAPSGTWQVFISHDSFDEVPEHTIIPQAIVNFKSEPVSVESV